MIDGLALGETTPGPLIMVVAFVGFVGAWTQQMFGAAAPFAAGVAGACVATFFTFLPSYLFILAGGPLVESTHGRIRFTAPLTGITAAVVGVIVNLALFFAWHVFWPRGAAGAVDPCCDRDRRAGGGRAVPVQGGRHSRDPGMWIAGTCGHPRSRVRNAPEQRLLTSVPYPSGRNSPAPTRSNANERSFRGRLP